MNFVFQMHDRALIGVLIALIYRIWTFSRVKLMHNLTYCWIYEFKV